MPYWRRRYAPSSPELLGATATKEHHFKGCATCRPGMSRLDMCGVGRMLFDAETEIMGGGRGSIPFPCPSCKIPVQSVIVFKDGSEKCCGSCPERHPLTCPTR